MPSLRHGIESMIQLANIIIIFTIFKYFIKIFSKYPKLFHLVESQRWNP